MKSIKRLFLALTAILALTAFAPLAAPSRPGLVSPVNKAVQVDPDAVTLKWKKSSPNPASVPVDDYDIEVSLSSAVDGNGDFSSIPVYTGNEPEPVPSTSTISHPIPSGNLVHGTMYYWHVRANASGDTSAWSSIGVFRVGVVPPTLVPLTAPDLVTLRPTFQWSHTANADSYTIQISTDLGFSTIYRTATILYSADPPKEYTPTTDLTPNVVAPSSFYWRVRANNSLLGTSAWSDIEAFETANPPTVPVLLSPNNAKVSPTPDLTWKIVSVQAGETFETYQIEIFKTKADAADDIPFFTANNTLDDAVAPKPSLGIRTTTSYSVPSTANLLSSTTYYWRIKAFNGDNEYSTSSLFTFYTTIGGQIASTTMDPSETLGNVPGLQGPTANTKTIEDFGGTMGDNVNLLNLNPTFKWDAGSMNAETFTLQVASKLSGSCNVATPEDSTFATLIINVNVSNADAEYTANLNKYPNYVLCWRIRGNHSLYGSSDWSDVQIFLAANSPSVPEIVGPINGTLTNDNSPKFLWKKVSLPSGAVFGKYEVEISFNSTFKGYDYPADTIPPYPDPIGYPLPDTIMPGLPVADAVQAITPPYSAFPKFPMVDQAHDEDDLANSHSVSEYQVEDDSLLTNNYLYGAHTYYWRVRAYNSYGEYSAWSISSSIKIAPDRPTNLHLTDCATPTGATITDPTDSRPCFEWDKVYKATRYKINIATKNTFGSSTIVTASTSSPKYQPIKDLPRDIPLFWRVTAIDTGTYGEGLYGYPDTHPLASFTSANSPDAPKLVAPVKNKLVPTTEPTFIWNIPYIPSGTNFDYYEIAISQDLNFTNLVEDPPAQITDKFVPQYTIAASTLDPATKYYWRVRACNDIPQCSSWSSASYFRTALDAPTLLPPPDDALPYSEQKPLFKWDHVNYATGYSIRISKSLTCNGTGSGGNTSAGINYYSPRTNLVSGTTYYWCVRANSSAYGPSLWSDIETYSVP